MLEEGTFDFGAEYVFTAAQHHVLQAIDNIEESMFVDTRDVTRV